jgi:hypothetical protein
MRLNASPIAWVLAAQAVRQLSAGPRTPNSPRKVRKRHVRLLLDLAHPIHRRMRDHEAQRTPSTFFSSAFQPARFDAA